MNPYLQQSDWDKVPERCGQIDMMGQIDELERNIELKHNLTSHAQNSLEENLMDPEEVNLDKQQLVEARSRFILIMK